MITASSLARNCRHDKDVLGKIPPATAAERTREANKRASADRGTLFHKAIEAWALGQVSHPACPDDAEIQGWLDLLAHQWRPPPTFEPEVAWGLSVEGGYRDVIEPEPHVYQAADGSKLLTAGRCDGIWTSDVEERTIRLVDWKAGKWPVEAAATNLQVNAAGIALTLKEFALRYVPGIYYARDGVWDWGEPVELGSPTWKQRLSEVQEAANLGTDPRPGPHCSNCWEKRRCPSAQER